MRAISTGRKEGTELEEAGFVDWLDLRGQEGKSISLLLFLD